MIIVALGSNLPGASPVSSGISSGGSFGPKENLRAGIDLMNRRGLRVVAESNVYTTSPVPYDPDQPDYQNMVVRIEGNQTSLDPAHCLSVLLRIEKDMGRVRTVPNAARTLDLDIIAFHDVVMNDPVLTIPHPRMHERGFVLYPMRDIAPNWCHPVLKCSIDDLIDRLPEDQKLSKNHDIVYL